jgi:hypothetical protein
MLRRAGVGLLSILVVLLVVAEDVFALTGLLVRKILPTNFEEFLRKQSKRFTYGVVGVAFVIYVPLHLGEYVTLWWGYYWSAVVFSLLSKVYSVSVTGYLCRVYSDRLLAVSWIRKCWGWYLGSKKWLESFKMYRVTHDLVVRTKDKVKFTIKRLRARPKGRSLLAVAWRMFRLKFRR